MSLVLAFNPVDGLILALFMLLHTPIPCLKFASYNQTLNLSKTSLNFKLAVVIFSAGTCKGPKAWCLSSNQSPRSVLPGSGLYSQFVPYLAACRVLMVWPLWCGQGCYPQSEVVTSSKPAEIKALFKLAGTLPSSSRGPSLRCSVISGRGVLAFLSAGTAARRSGSPAVLRAGSPVGPADKAGANY